MLIQLIGLPALPVPRGLRDPTGPEWFRLDLPDPAGMDPPTTILPFLVTLFKCFMMVIVKSVRLE